MLGINSASGVEGRTPRATSRIRLAATFATALLAACAGNSTTATIPGRPPSSPPPAVQPFQHVIVIVQENRTVDNMFNGFPGADTVRQGNRNGTIVPLIQVPLQPQLTRVHDLGHGHNAFVDDYDGGKMDGFDHEFTPDEGTAYAYVDPHDVRTYWTLASRFTLADEVFQANIGPSFPAHIAIIAGQTGYPLAVDNNPTNNSGLTGCFGSERSRPRRHAHAVSRANVKNGPACVEVQTVFDLLDVKGLSWRYYVADYGAGSQLWDGPDYVRHIALGAGHRNVVSPDTRVLADIRSHSPAGGIVRDSGRVHVGPSAAFALLPARRPALGGVDHQCDRHQRVLEEHAHSRDVGRLGRLVRSRSAADHQRR